MKIQFYRTDKLRPSMLRRFVMNIHSAIRTSIVLVLPMPIALITGAIWYYLFFVFDFHFAAEANEIVITSWSALFILFLTISTGRVFDTVWDKYKTMEAAVDEHDESTFIRLRLAHQHPIVFIMLAICSMAVVGTFFCIKYPDHVSGLVIIGSSAYFCALMLIVLHELDSPTTGFLFIENIPIDWNDIDPRRLKALEFRSIRQKQS
jgi:glucan phosphoethanolaminetransferase (alkaline phosphatase superfamily)